MASVTQSINPNAHTAFFYGTLMAPQVLHRVIHGTSRPTTTQSSRITFQPALLPNYRRHRVRYCDYPAIVPHAGSTVRGSYVTGLSPADIARLDIFEGSQYDRVPVKVRLLKGVGLDQKVDLSATVGGIPGEEVEAETYVFREQDRARDLEDGEWDFEQFKRERMRFWMGEPRGWDEIQADEYAEEQSSSAEGEIDEGFADVDRAVAEGRVEAVSADPEDQTRDPTGGRGFNGAITKQLEEIYSQKRH